MEIEQEGLAFWVNESGDLVLGVAKENLGPLPFARYLAKSQELWQLAKEKEQRKVYHSEVLLNAKSLKIGKERWTTWLITNS